MRKVVMAVMLTLLSAAAGARPILNTPGSPFRLDVLPAWKSAVHSPDWFSPDGIHRLTAGSGKLAPQDSLHRLAQRLLEQHSSGRGVRTVNFKLGGEPARRLEMADASEGRSTLVVSRHKGHYAYFVLVSQERAREHAALVRHLLSSFRWR